MATDKQILNAYGQSYKNMQEAKRQHDKINKGEISKSMGVYTKSAKKIDIAGFWVLVDPNMPDSMFEKLKMAIIIHDVEFINENQNQKNLTKNAVKCQ